MDLVRDTIAMFQNRFGGSPQCLVTAPGRVNLIGEHTDYNEGFVLPAAIDKLTVVAAGRGSDNQLRMYSKNVDSMVGVSLDDLQPRRDDAWVNYITGVAFFLQLSGVRLQAANLCINGDIPLGTGLSSSASLEIASAFVFRCLSDFQHSELELIKLCQRAENEFVGVHCGIMDQFICCLGKANHALFLDCRDLSYQHIPFPGGVRLVVCDTGVRRGLASSEYNRRRE